MPQKTFYIENLGCAKNQVDGEALATVLEDSGWLPVRDAAEASLIIVNTCGFIDAAKKESVGVLLEFRRLYPHKKILAAGCLAQRYGKELFAALPEADGVFGNRDPGRVAGIALSLSVAGNGNARELLLPEVYGSLPVRKRLFSVPGSVYIKAAEGCDNRCAFCAIPLIRGGLKSRSLSDIRAEIEIFIDRGTREFNIIAQDLGSYGKDLKTGTKTELPGLLRGILSLPGDYRLRLLYIHPEHFPAEILKLCAEDRRLLPYFDLPFQHASPAVLRAMGRRAGMEENLRLIETIRGEAKEAVIRSTFLVGFPGETEEDFQALLDFQRRAAFDWLGCFTYSPEEGTPAEELHRRKGLRVSRKTALARKKLVEETQIPITEKRLERFTGQRMELLVEEQVQGENLCLARAWFQAPEVDGLTVLHTGEGSPPAAGSMIQAKIIRRNNFDMEAVLV
ncbi:MAG: 30S ribosomal protein S12 methylthiotransferase RimO [Spirochaetales bacterium]|jgi:ribosomal protein S12 methylthiotransferase|nr:30S ribosomal protein S12 methylthiotransferase RimO [Spirochaetales bacterium]